MLEELPLPSLLLDLRLVVEEEDELAGSTSVKLSLSSPSSTCGSLSSFPGGWFRTWMYIKRFCLCYPGRVGLKLQLPLGPLPVAGLASRMIMHESTKIWRGQLSYDCTT